MVRDTICPFCGNPLTCEGGIIYCPVCEVEMDLSPAQLLVDLL